MNGPTSTTARAGEPSRYAGRSDLPELLASAAQAACDRFPLRPTWQPGDFTWSLKAAYDDPHRLYLWRSEGRVVAVAWFVDPQALWLEILPEHEAAIPRIIAWAETETRGDRLAVRAFDADLRRTEILGALGYRRRAPEGVQFEVDLADVPPPLLPDGFRFRDCVDIDPEARAACHRDAWSALDHIGIKDARSSFTRDVYQSLREAPLYDPTLDILIEAPDGRLVANCICWADPLSRVGHFEPVGTHPDYRGQRLAGSMIHEGLRRLKGAGMTTARVGTAHFNIAAIAAYAGAGFEKADESWWWTKRLDTRSGLSPAPPAPYPG